MPEPFPIAAVIVTYRSGRTISECLAALAPELGADDALVVVDNASPGGVADLAEAIENIRADVPRLLQTMGRNVGFGRACNRGAEMFSEHHVLLLNPDAVLQPGALSVLRGFLSGHPEYGAVGPRVERFDGTVEPGCRRTLPRPGVAFGRLSRLDRVFPQHFGRYNLLGTDSRQPADVEAASGCCALIRRRAWDDVGGFDPRFFMYGEDLDLFLRLGTSGWRTRYVPTAHVLHHKGASTDMVPTRMLFEFHRAMWIYYRKHHLHGRDAALAPAVLVGLSTRFATLASLQALRRIRSLRRSSSQLT